MGIEGYFFDIGVYRCDRDSYFKDRNEAKRKFSDELRPHGLTFEDNPGLFVLAEEHFIDRYGGAWRFNQVIGWMRLYVLGMQIRGETWFTKAKRIRRDIRKKRFAYYGKAFESYCLPEYSSTDIFHEVLSDLEHLRNEKPFKGRFIDLEAFRNIGPDIDWRELVGYV